MSANERPVGGGKIAIQIAKTEAGWLEVPTNNASVLFFAPEFYWCVFLFTYIPI